MSCKVGNQTNSQDPQAVNSRVFVGNLNTFQCSKTDVERIFQRYGRIAGISMHKGYAFIQFTNPFDARSACLGEDGRLIWGQTLDVNMVAEPKSHQTGRKRQNIAKTGNDWDYYYDSLKVQLESLYRSYYASVGLPPGPRLVPPLKRPRIHGPATSRPSAKTPSPNKASHPNNLATNSITTVSTASLTDLKTYSTPDILICGNCREHFTEVEQLIEHKKTYCKLRFTCKCHLLNGSKLSEEPAALLCSQCKDSFSSAWDLMVHVQAAHMLNIYQLSSDPSSGGSSRDQSETREFKHMGMIGDGIPNGLNPNGTLMGDSLMEDSHCQTDLSSTASSSSTSSIMSASSQQAIITQSNHHLHNHHHPQQQHLHNPYHHLHNNRIEDSSTMTDVATSTGVESINTSSHAQQLIVTSGMGGNGTPNCLVDNAVVSQQQNSSIGTGTTTIMTNSLMMTDGHGGGGGGGGGGTAASQNLLNGNDSGMTMCSSSQCSTPVNHSTVTNGPFLNSSASSQGGQMIIGGQVHSSFINSNNNNNNNNNNIGNASSSNSSSSSYETSSSINVAVSQPMEASTQTQTMQVDESLLNHHAENNNGPSNITNNNGGGSNGGTVAGGGAGGMQTNFDEHCSIVSTLKQEGSNMHLSFPNGQVASI